MKKTYSQPTATTNNVVVEQGIAASFGEIRQAGTDMSESDNNTYSY